MCFQPWLLTCAPERKSQILSWCKSAPSRWRGGASRQWGYADWHLPCRSGAKPWTDSQRFQDEGGGTQPAVAGKRGAPRRLISPEAFAQACFLVYKCEWVSDCLLPNWKCYVGIYWHVTGMLHVYWHVIIPRREEKKKLDCTLLLLVLWFLFNFFVIQSWLFYLNLSFFLFIGLKAISKV